MRNRRRFERRWLEMPVSISTSDRRDRAGMIRDMSESGILIHSVSELAVGERVVLVFRVGRDRSSSASGRVVRVYCDTSGDNILRFFAAVQFDAPLLDLRLEANIAPQSLDWAHESADTPSGI